MEIVKGIAYLPANALRFSLALPYLLTNYAVGAKIERKEVLRSRVSNVS
jgi:hypothetical protein